MSAHILKPTGFLKISKHKNWYNQGNPMKKEYKEMIRNTRLDKIFFNSKF